MQITRHDHACRLVRHLATIRGLSSANTSSIAHWRPVADDDAGRAELGRRIQALLDHDPSGLHGDEQGEALKTYARCVLGVTITRATEPPNPDRERTMRHLAGLGGSK